MNAAVYTHSFPDSPKRYAVQCWQGDTLVFTYHCVDGLLASTEYWAKERFPTARIKSVEEPWPNLEDV